VNCCGPFLIPLRPLPNDVTFLPAADAAPATTTLTTLPPLQFSWLFHTIEQRLHADAARMRDDGWTPRERLDVKNRRQDAGLYADYTHIQHLPIPFFAMPRWFTYRLPLPTSTCIPSVHSDTLLAWTHALLRQGRGHATDQPAITTPFTPTSLFHAPRGHVRGTRQTALQALFSRVPAYTLILGCTLHGQAFSNAYSTRHNAVVAATRFITHTVQRHLRG